MTIKTPAFCQEEFFRKVSRPKTNHWPKDEPMIYDNNDEILEWDDKKLYLLLYGYIRNNINIAITDISSIIFNYIKNMFVNSFINIDKQCYATTINNNTILCDFKINDMSTSNNSHSLFTESTIIFTPYISTILNKYNQNNKQTMIYQMKLNICNYYPYRFQCGII